MLYTELFNKSSWKVIYCLKGLSNLEFKSVKRTCHMILQSEHHIHLSLTTSHCYSWLSNSRQTASDIWMELFGEEEIRRTVQIMKGLFYNMFRGFRQLITHSIMNLIDRSYFQDNDVILIYYTLFYSFLDNCIFCTTLSCCYCVKRSWNNI